MKLGLQGVSVIFSSGDSGVAPQDEKGTKFAPMFPATCPYVTAVGMTERLSNDLMGGEKAAAIPNKSKPRGADYSGGGFSDIFQQPSYQSSAASDYLTNYSPNYADALFNHAGRGYPDVSALGHGIPYVSNHKSWFSDGHMVASGTSASAPIFASIVTLLNEERLAQGKGPIGFLNPVIYAYVYCWTQSLGTDGFCGAVHLVVSETTANPYIHRF